MNKIDWKLIVVTLVISVLILLGLVEYKIAMIRILMPIFGVSLVGYMVYVLLVALGVRFWKEEK